ncbi:hypothetical protein [Bdellovibrio sp. HCB2-146]|uniref:hypothetical protein n=1 Tax=Bdellovibrio sp. HCB2-146 TaxID=3394362 RepID=UPI0039BD5BDC
MKKAALLLTSLFALTSVLTACQPSDSKITDPRVGNVRTNNKKNQKNDQQRAPGFFALAAFTVEKEVEAIQMARVALGVDDATASGFTVSETREDGSVELVANKKAAAYDGNFGTYTSVDKKKYVVSAKAAGDISNEIVKVQGNDLRQYTSNVANYDVVQVFEKNYSVTVESLEADTLQISLETEAGINQRNVKFPDNKSWYVHNLNIVLTVDRESLRTNNVKVLKATHEISWKLNNGRKNSVKTAGENHVVSVADGCYSLTGDSVILTDKTKKVLSYKNSQAEVVGSSFKTVAGQCGSRPTVDLSRLLVY